METPPTPPPLPPELPPSATTGTKRPGGILIGATVLVGLGALALAILASGLGASATSLSYRLGNIIGGMVFFPLIVIALFSIGRRFRNARSHTIILLVVWLLGIFGNFGRLAERAGESLRQRRESAQAMAEMEQKIRELQRRAVSASATERLQLGQQARQALEEALPKLAPDDRAAMLVAIRIVNPIIEEGGAFAEELAAFQQSPEWSLATATTQEEIRARIAKLDKLTAKSVALHQRITTLEADATRILKDEPLDPQMKAGLIKGIKGSSARKFTILAAVQSTQQRSFRAYKEALQLLHDQWGHWRGKDGVVVWDTQANLDEFNKIVTAMQASDREIAALQKRYYAEQQ